MTKKSKQTFLVLLTNVQYILLQKILTIWLLFYITRGASDSKELYILLEEKLTWAIALLSCQNN